jgi:hypothetical protein
MWQATRTPSGEGVQCVALANYEAKQGVAAGKSR